jgi:hypothetical protein
VLAVKHYLAIADRAQEGAPWRISFPAFPGLVASAASFRDIPREAGTALAGALQQGGRAAPLAVEDGGPGPDDHPLEGYRRPSLFLIPVAVPAPEPSGETWPKEIGGPAGPEPTRFGDWEQKGRATDF